MPFDTKESLFISKTFNNLQFTENSVVNKEFDNCLFSGCNFTETSFGQCKFIDCTFLKCNLSLIKITNSSFFNTTFEDSKLIGVNWTEMRWPLVRLAAPIKFYKCILNHCVFLDLDLKELEIIESTVQDADFRGANLTEANFSYSDLEKTMFINSILVKADFTDAKNYTIDVYQNNIKGAKFSFPDVVNLLNSLDIELIGDY